MIKENIFRFSFSFPFSIKHLFCLYYIKACLWSRFPGAVRNKSRERERKKQKRLCCTKTPRITQRRKKIEKRHSNTHTLYTCSPSNTPRPVYDLSRRDFINRPHYTRSHDLIQHHELPSNTHTQTLRHPAAAPSLFLSTHPVKRSTSAPDQVEPCSCHCQASSESPSVLRCRGSVASAASSSCLASWPGLATSYSRILMKR